MITMTMLHIEAVVKEEYDFDGQLFLEEEQVEGLLGLEDDVGTRGGCVER